MSAKKIYRKMVLLFFLIPSLFIGILTFFGTKEALINSKTADLNYLAYSSANQISRIIEKQFSSLQMFSNRFSLQLDIKASEKNISSSSRQHALMDATKYNYLFSDYAFQYPYCSSFILYDADGCVLVSSSSKVDDVYFENIKNAADTFSASSQPILATVQNKRSAILQIIQPIISRKGEVLGYLCCTIDTQNFEGLFHTSYFNTESYIVLADNTGNILYSAQSAPDKMTADHESLTSLISRQHGNVYLVPDDKTSKNPDSDNKVPKKEKYIFTSAPVEKTSWTVLIFMNYEPVIQPARVNLFAILIITVLIFIFTFFLSGFYKRHYINPIFSMKETMKQVSNGDFSVRCDIPKNDELADLARSFNKMIQIIQTNYEDLSSMHEQLRDNESEIRSNYSRIEYLAYHDLLTDLPNKLFFLEKLNGLLNSQISINKHHAIFFIDLDNFKTVNDTLGHDYGDQILNLTGNLLSGFANGSDMVARVGGDEFLFFKYDIKDDEEAYAFAQKVLLSFQTPFKIRDERIHISPSIGISIYPQNGTDHHTLIKNADIAMYYSKEGGKNRISMYNEKMSEKLMHDTKILEVLRTAIEKNEVYLLYQPQVSIEDNHIIGYEVLLRIESEMMGPLYPSDFIPIAEESGMIIPLGEWTLREACRFTKSLIDKGCPPYEVSVNISSIQLNKPEIANTIRSILEETGLPPEYLVLEITESTLISSFVDAVSLLNSFKALGVKIAMDDFGTGYSSLKYLTSLPIDLLKIDKAFIDNICTNKKDSYTANSIITLAHGLNIQVIAEGIEHYDQYKLLKEFECDIIQGYLFSRPIKDTDLTEILENGGILQISEEGL